MWIKLHPRANDDHLGWVAHWFYYGRQTESVRPAKEVVNAHYKHGGGWQPYAQDKWTWNGVELQYPEDDPIPALWKLDWGGEEVYCFPHAIFMIRNKATGKYEVARLD